MKKSLILLFTVVTLSAWSQEKRKFEFSPLPAYSPREYVCYKTSQAIVMDGVIDQQWNTIPWTADFVDIEGDKQPLPHYRTRAKMCWDDKFLYIAAEMEEPHIWGKLTERESVIFHDNDFEIFIDPTASTHSYMEFEINALGTEWDLFLNTPYRDKGNFYLNAWNFNLKSVVKCYGTINDPTDKDEKWCVEVAIPWSSITEVRGRAMYKAGDHLKVNFSRVQWTTEIVDGDYVKCNNPRTGKINEYNWVWSPQGAIDMHRPELWGSVLLSDGAENFVKDKEDLVRWKLRCLYYRQREYFDYYGKYASSAKALKAEDIFDKEELKRLCIDVLPTMYEMSFDAFKIYDNGKITK